CLATQLAGCHDDRAKSASLSTKADTESLSLVERILLMREPFSELSFVPQDAQALVRVDLAAVASRAPQSGRMLDFVFHAQQPAIWEFMGRAGITIGREITALYLVSDASSTLGTGAGTNAHVPSDPTVVVAAVGGIDRNRVMAALRHAGGKLEVAPNGASVVVWPPSEGNVVGAHEPHEKPLLGETAIGIAEDLLVCGSSPLVRSVLATKTGQKKDIRSGRLAREIMAVDRTAIVWGVGLSTSPQSYLAKLAPGVRKVRFQAIMPPNTDTEPAEPGKIELRAEFASVQDATSTRSSIEALLNSGMALGASTPVGGMIRQLRETASFSLDGTTMTVKSEVTP
ncbi:MAG: hypothetical protein V2A73_03255, partial [Pseudomonadota bacterium]